MMRSLSIGVACLSLPTMAARAQTERVGTFDRQSIVIAFYRSPMYATMIKERIAAHDSAKKSGDSARVRELERWGSGQQELAHQQLAGHAPLTNILEVLRPALDSIKKAGQLRDVVAAPVKDTRTAVVDVTPQLLDWLKADAKTRDLIAHMPPDMR